jgi:hypothetical protein
MWGGARPWDATGIECLLNSSVILHISRILRIHTSVAGSKMLYCGNTGLMNAAAVAHVNLPA